MRRTLGPIREPLVRDRREACWAWISMNGTGTVAINGSFNVASIVDNGVGDWSVAWINPFSTANYAVGITGSTLGDVVATIIHSGCNVAGTAQATTGVRLAAIAWNNGGTVNDINPICVTAWGTP